MLLLLHTPYSSTYSSCNNQMVGNALREEITTFISDKSYWHRARSYSVLNYACVHFSMSLKIIQALDFNPS